MEQLEEFLMDDDVERGLGSSTITSDEWWDDGLILKEFLDGLIQSDFPSILSEEDHDQSININNIDNHHQQLEATDLFIDYFTNNNGEEHNTVNGGTTDADHQQHEEEEEEEEEPQQQQQHQTDQQHVYDHVNEEKNGQEEEEMMMDQAETGNDGSKNLVSERNRRKRLNEQLFTLRSIVPNITKMDKRSILVDALAYLQSILQQTEAEMENINSSSVLQELAASSLGMKSSLSSSSMENIGMEPPPPPPPMQQSTDQPPPPVPYERCAALPAISKIEVEKLDDERFILKIAFNKVLGAMGQVQRSIEMLGLEITSISVYEQDEHHMETMNFLRVKKKGLVILTEEDLLRKVQKTAKQLGLLFVNSDN